MCSSILLLVYGLVELMIFRDLERGEVLLLRDSCCSQLEC
jgi:hypothetical protein